MSIFVSANKHGHPVQDNFECKKKVSKCLTVVEAYPYAYASKRCCFVYISFHITRCEQSRVI